MLNWIYRRLRPHRSQAYKPVILITGCSSGIGLALSRLLSTYLEYRLILTSRSSSLHRLREEGFCESDQLWLRPLDVTNPLEIGRLFDEIREKWERVDILVNNAGVSYRAVVEHMDEQSERNQMAVNFHGPMSLIRAVLPAMRKSGRGKIISVSSVSGMLAMPTMSAYSASKYALEGACEALWYEMRPLGINVSIVQPGFVNSRSFERVLFSERSKPEHRSTGPYADYYRYMEPFVAKMMTQSPSTPEKLARKIFRVIRTQNPPLRIPATPDAIAFYYLRRWIPRRLFHPFLFWCLPKTHKWAEGYSHARYRKRSRSKMLGE